jgi:hypothetical protein
MSCELTADCLEVVFQFLEWDKRTLHSCVLVCRLWCKVSIRILWKTIWDHNCYWRYCCSCSSLLSTLIACLPNESKNLLNRNGIVIPTQFQSLHYSNMYHFAELSQLIEFMILLDVSLKICKQLLQKTYLTVFL